MQEMSCKDLVKEVARMYPNTMCVCVCWPCMFLGPRGLGMRLAVIRAIFHFYGPDACPPLILTHTPN